MHESFLNTEAWAEFQRSVGHPVWRFNNGTIAATIIRHDVGFRKNYLYVPHGPTLDVNPVRERPAEGSASVTSGRLSSNGMNAMQAVKNEIMQFIWFVRRLAKEQRSMFVKIEPQTDTAIELLQSHGARFRFSRKRIQPHKSLVLDLAPAEEELLSQMHHKTRYNIQLAQRKGLEFSESSERNVFWGLMQKTSVADGFSPHPRDYYGKLLALTGELETKLFIVRSGITPIAGIILLVHGDTAYYLHGAMDREYRNLMAPQFMQWEAIRWAKQRGCMRYDFWGIDSDRWPGVTRFKLGFGGKQVEYPGAFDLVISRFWYFVYNLIRKFR